MEDLKRLCEDTNSKSISEFRRSAEKLANRRCRRPFTRLIPNIEIPTRLIILSETEFRTLSSLKISTGQLVRHVSRGVEYEYLILKERIKEDNCCPSIGVCLASIETDKSIGYATNSILSYSRAETVTQVLGRDGHKRPCTGHGGHSSFRGCCRATKRPNPNPAVPDADIELQAYYDQNRMKNHFGILGVEMVLKRLSELAFKSAKRLQPSLMDLPDEELPDRRLVTSGLSSIWKNCLTFLGFCNGEHIDVNDLKAKEEFRKWAGKSQYGEYLMRVLEVVDCGTATTCQYKHIWANGISSRDYQVNAYFMHHGVGIAHPLKDCSCHSFLGYAYSHSTSLCYLEDTDGNVWIDNSFHGDIFNLFAWGNGGNSRRRRAQSLQLRGRGIATRA